MKTHGHTKFFLITYYFTSLNERHKDTTVKLKATYFALQEQKVNLDNYVKWHFYRHYISYNSFKISVEVNKEPIFLIIKVK